MKKTTRTFWIAIGVILALAVLVATVKPAVRTRDVSITTVVEEVSKDQVDRIEVTGDQISVKLKDASAPIQLTRKEAGSTLKDYGIDASKVTVVAKNPDDGSGKWIDLAIQVGLPILLVVGLFFFFMRQGLRIYQDT